MFVCLCQLKYEHQKSSKCEGYCFYDIFKYRDYHGYKSVRVEIIKEINTTENEIDNNKLDCLRHRLFSKQIL